MLAPTLVESSVLPTPETDSLCPVAAYKAAMQIMKNGQEAALLCPLPLSPSLSLPRAVPEPCFSHGDFSWASITAFLHGSMLTHKLTTHRPPSSLSCSETSKHNSTSASPGVSSRCSRHPSEEEPLQLVPNSSTVLASPESPSQSFST